MTEHRNVQQIRDTYAALAGGDLSAALGGLAPDVTLHFNGSGPLGGDHSGPDGVGAALAKVVELTAGTQKIEVHSVFADDRHGIVMLRETASRPDGVTLDVEEVHVLALNGEGRIAEIWDLPDDPGAHDRFFDGD
jgi:ketosteroid isomerase-like protein